MNSRRRRAVRRIMMLGARASRLPAKAVIASSSSHKRHVVEGDMWVARRARRGGATARGPSPKWRAGTLVGGEKPFFFLRSQPPRAPLSSPPSPPHRHDSHQHHRPVDAHHFKSHRHQIASSYSSARDPVSSTLFVDSDRSDNNNRPSLLASYTA